jgi:integrase
LRPDQMTRLKWEAYQSKEKSKREPRQLYNTRKTLREILKRAHEEGMIKAMPKLPLKDAEPEPPKYIPKEHMLRILRRASRPTKLLVFIMWKQGARPGEVIQYRYSMLRWDEGPHGSIDIPGAITKTGRRRKIPLNAKVSRVLRFLAARADGDCIFPSPRDSEQPQREYKTGWRTALKANGRRRPGQRKGVKSSAAKPLPYTIYNVRDTFITDALRRGFSSVFVGKYCDTSSSMIDRRYAVAEERVMTGVAG